MKLLPSILILGIASACQSVTHRAGQGFDVPYSYIATTSGSPHGLQVADPDGSQATAPEGPGATAKEGWTGLVKLYFFASGLDGTIGTGRTAQDIDASFTDLWDSLDFGMMLSFEVRPPSSKWTILTDLMYVALDKDGKSQGPLQADVNATLDQFIGELSVALELVDQGKLELIGGIRYWDMDTQLQIALPTPRTAGGRVDWIDPLIGARSRLALGSSFDLLLRADLGGFGVGSDISYNLDAELGWSLSKAFQMTLGYRYLYVDYTDEASYDMAQAGPVLGLAFRF